MSVKATTWVWEHSQSKGAARLVLLSLADYAGADNGDAWPSIATLVRRTHLTDRGVQKALADLTALGELEVLRNAGPGGTNRYRLTFESIATPEPASPPNEVHPRTTSRHTPERGSDEPVLEPVTTPQPPQVGEPSHPKTPGKAAERAAEKAARTETDQHQGQHPNCRQCRTNPRGAREATAEERRMAAQRELAERGRRQRTGEACPECADNGLVELEGVAYRCPCPAGLVHSHVPMPPGAERPQLAVVR